MVESVKYSVVSRRGDVEIRGYREMVLATVSGLNDNDAFGLLFDYISGNNSSSQRIPMTTPVVSGAETSEELPMTAPVVSSPGSFSFVMPAGRDARSLPKPKDGRVVVVEVPERTIAVLRFRGRANARQTKAKEAQLLDELRRMGISNAGKPFLMRYNPPFIPGIFRRNEVAVEVEFMEGGA